ncbi:hypothetical protein [uncultured Chryseobacterium sp.]|uniref:hypothetical protein n=1 Tax=uncultured Chryseobacterium sp. TaxID=259322 RepID=UPI0025F0A50F|nr:hypothetical protein [uncultured Chryseobacterium sp.]
MRSVSVLHFEKLLSDFYRPAPEYDSGNPLPLTPEMHLLISQMTGTAYTGNMRSLFLEAKMTELFLLHLQQSRTLTSRKYFTIRNSEKDKIYHVRELIQHHNDQFLTISELAQRSGLPPQKTHAGI